MKRREFILGSSAALLSASASPAQEPGPFSVPGVRYRDEAEFVRCGTPTPSLPVQRRIAEQEARFQRLNPDATERIKALISVHFHVIHDGDVGRIPESMIDDQIDVLNDAYFRRRNNIVFEKASVDYTDNASWFVLGFGTPEEREAKTNLVIESDRSLNFYTASPTDPTDPTDVLLGFATLPWNLAGDPDLDGVVVLFDSLPGGAAAPYNLGDTGTHEVGHWLGLFHTYEGGCVPPGDSVRDTPFEAEPAFGCPVGRNTCHQSGKDPVRNFMDNSDDSCMDKFTAQQYKRMLKFIGLYRPNLLEPSMAKSLRLVTM